MMGVRNSLILSSESMFVLNCIIGCVFFGFVFVFFVVEWSLCFRNSCLVCPVTGGDRGEVGSKNDKIIKF